MSFILLMGPWAAASPYAGVMGSCRVPGPDSSAWAHGLNLIGSAVAIGPYVLALVRPGEFRTGRRAVPSHSLSRARRVRRRCRWRSRNWLFARGLRVLSPPEAGIITLIEAAPEHASGLINDAGEGRRRPVPMVIGGS